MNLMKFICTFEAMTGVKVKDAISDTDEQENPLLIFVVEQHMIGKAIGRHGSNVQRLGNIFNRKIKIVEFNPSVLQFIKNFVYPLKLRDAKEENGIITLVGEDTKTKGKLIGRESKNIKKLRTYVKRLFRIEDIKVV